MLNFVDQLVKIELDDPAADMKIFFEKNPTRGKFADL